MKIYCVMSRLNILMEITRGSQKKYISDYLMSQPFYYFGYMKGQNGVL